MLGRLNLGLLIQVSSPSALLDYPCSLNAKHGLVGATGVQLYSFFSSCICRVEFEDDAEMEDDEETPPADKSSNQDKEGEEGVELEMHE
jgi:hypothetical protein